MYLNGDSSVAPVFHPANKWDRTRQITASTVGWLGALDDATKECLAEVEIKTVKNTVCDGGGTETTIDKVYLLARENVYAGRENGQDEGGVSEWYQQNSSLSSAGTGADTNRIKIYSSSGTAWWLRTPAYNRGGYTRQIASGGACDTTSSTNERGFAPAFTIA
jgi:hypothetical protein